MCRGGRLKDPAIGISPKIDLLSRGVPLHTHVGGAYVVVSRVTHLMCPQGLCRGFVLLECVAVNVLSSPPLPLPRPLLLLRSEHTMQPTRTPLASPVPARPRTSFQLKGASVSEGEGEECCGCGEGVSTYTDSIVKLWSHSSTHTHTSHPSVAMSPPSHAQLRLT